MCREGAGSNTHTRHTPAAHPTHVCNNPRTMSMTAAWAMPNKQMVLTPGRGKNDSPEDKLILQILSAPRHRSAPALTPSASASSLPAGSGSSLTRTMTRSESKGALARATSTADFGVPCYPPKSPYRREMLARSKSWRAGPRAGVLRIDVLKASGLMAADLSGFSDPYVVVTCGGKRLKTKIIEQTLEPVWEQALEFKGQLEDFLRTGVRLQVFDWDELGMHDVLGECTVKLLPELLAHTTPSGRDYSKRLSTEGRLVFSITWVPEPPRGFTVVELADQLAKTKRTEVPAGKERVSIPVLLPHKVHERLGNQFASLDITEKHTFESCRVCSSTGSRNSGRSRRSSKQPNRARTGRFRRRHRMRSC